MSTIHLRVITPVKIVKEEDVNSVTATTVEGEITVLPRHMNLFCLLAEGVVKIKKGAGEDFLAIGGGYLETDGKEINLLVSRAYGQSEIDQQATEKAIKEAEKLLKEAKDQQQLHEAQILYRRSLIELKLLKKHGRRQPHPTPAESL